MVETIVCWYLPGTRIIPLGFLRWCLRGFRHPPQHLWWFSRRSSARPISKTNKKRSPTVHGCEIHFAPPKKPKGTNRCPNENTHQQAIGFQTHGLFAAPPSGPFRVRRSASFRVRRRQRRGDHGEAGEQEPLAHRASGLQGLGHEVQAPRTAKQKGRRLFFIFSFLFPCLFWYTFGCLTC